MLLTQTVLSVQFETVMTKYSGNNFLKHLPLNNLIPRVHRKLHRLLGFIPIIFHKIIASL